MTKLDNRSEDFTTVRLDPARWQRLFELATRATVKHAHGGWQDRLRQWCEQMDEGSHTVWLRHASPNGRRVSDIEFIRQAIRQRNVGGWQKHCCDIFRNMHPAFTGLRVRKRPIR